MSSARGDCAAGGDVLGPAAMDVTGFETPELPRSAANRSDRALPSGLTAPGPQNAARPFLTAENPVPARLNWPPANTSGISVSTPLTWTVTGDTASVDTTATEFGSEVDTIGFHA